MITFAGINRVLIDHSFFFTFLLFPFTTLCFLNLIYIQNFKETFIYVTLMTKEEK